MTPYLEAIVKEGGSIIEKAKGTVPSRITAFSGPKGYCWKTPVSIRELTSTYQKIYDFQFKLMAVFASYFRFMTGKTAARKVGKSFDDIMKDGNLEQTSITEREEFTTACSYVLYNLQQWKVMEEYCDLLEYTEGGKRPTECQGIKTSISDLLNRKKRQCILKSTGVIGISSKPESKTDKAFISLKDLFAGKWVRFQIPDANWLSKIHQTHKIIGNIDIGSELYLRNVYIFPPVSSNTSRRVTVHVRFSGRNQLLPSEKVDYVIVPQRELIFEYHEGGYVPCDHDLNSKKIGNVYNICPNRKLRDVCLLTENTQSEPDAVDPSMFSIWMIRVDGYQNYTVPEPKTDLSIRMSMKFCTIRNRKVKREVDDYEPTYATTRMCCKGNSYYSWKLGSCQRLGSKLYSDA